MSPKDPEADIDRKFRLNLLANRATISLYLKGKCAADRDLKVEEGRVISAK